MRLYSRDTFTRARREYWENLRPASGRPHCSSLSCPDNWGLTKGSDVLKQHKEETTDKEIEDVIQLQNGFNGH